MNERRWVIASILMLAVVGAIIYLELAPKPPVEVAVTPLVEVPITPSEPAPVPMPLAAATPAPKPNDPGLVLAPRIHFDRNGLLWEERIKRILAMPVSDSEKSILLFSLLQNVPEEAYSTVTGQAVELLRDPDYQMVAAPIIVNPATHGMIMSVLFSDLMERPDSITLPILLAIARTPTHPFAPSARDNLNLLLGQDFESDWGAWENAVRQRLAGK